MTLAEKRELARAVATTAGLMGFPLDAEMIAAFVERLSRYPLQVVLTGLQAVERDERGRLTLKSILDRLGAGVGHLRGNEAWSLSQAAEDERNTMVWTTEMQRAWHQAQPLVEGGDKIAARMAFLEAYDRFCAEARNAGRMPEVVVTRGWDASTADGAIARARVAGLLTAEDAERLSRLSGTTAPRIAGGSTGMGGLITGFAESVKQDGLTDAQKQTWKDLIAELKAAPAKRELQRAEQQAQEARDLEALKQRKLDELRKAEEGEGGDGVV
jgi:hypothetical protein